MKKIIIMLLIVFYMLSFVGVSYSDNDITSSGGLWNSLIGLEKACYIRGFRDGLLEGMGELQAVSKTSEPNREEAMVFYAWIKHRALYDFIWKHGEAISAVMDDLYKDPANMYITLKEICVIASQELKGEDIEPLLQKARKEALL